MSNHKLTRRDFINTGAASAIAAATVNAKDKTPELAEPTQNLKQKLTGDWQARGSKGAVVAGGKASVAAGLGILKSGGNAADAAAATLIALTVTDYRLYCFGGEVPIIHYNAKEGHTEVIAGQGVAPKLATFAHFEKRRIPGTGGEPAAVPAVVDACLTLIDRHGTATFEQIATPTMKILSRGKVQWRKDMRTSLGRLIDAEKQSKGDRKSGLKRVADYFYRGPLAKELVEWAKENSCLIRDDDMAAHVTRIEEPETTDYRGHTVCKCGAWTQGPYLLQSLRMLERFDLKKMGYHSTDTIHVAVESMKLALADRDRYYADPLFETVPMKQMLSDDYTNMRRDLIDMDKASMRLRPGDPHNMKALLENEQRDHATSKPNDTTTCITGDIHGNVVAATPSGWGGVVAGKTGIWMGTRLQSFNNWKDHPNCIEPGKRPRITLTPTIVLKDNKPVAAFSVAGGDMQDQATLQMLLNHIEFGMNPSQVVTAPHYGTNHLIGSFRQTRPSLGSLTVQDTLDKQIVAELKTRGHHLRTTGGTMSYRTAMSIDSEGVLHVAGDRRAGRNAMAI